MTSPPHPRGEAREERGDAERVRGKAGDVRRRLKVAPLLLVLVLSLLPRSMARRHHKLTAPSLTCNGDFTATVQTGSWAVLQIEGTSPRDQDCRSQRTWASVTFDLKTQCGVKVSNNVYSFAVIARYYVTLSTDLDRRIPMSCTYYLSGDAQNKWQFGDDSNEVTEEYQQGIRIVEDKETISLIDEAPPDHELGASVQSAQPDKATPPEKEAPPEAEKKAPEVVQPRSEKRRSDEDKSRTTGTNKNIPFEASMQRGERLSYDESEISTLPDGRAVYRPQNYWYLAPVFAGVFFIAVFVLLVYVRHVEQSRKLKLLGMKSKRMTRRTPTLEDIRAIVTGDSLAAAAVNGTDAVDAETGGASSGRCEADGTVPEEQVAPSVQSTG